MGKEEEERGKIEGGRKGEGMCEIEGDRARTKETKDKEMVKCGNHIKK